MSTRKTRKNAVIPYILPRIPRMPHDAGAGGRERRIRSTRFPGLTDREDRQLDRVPGETKATRPLRSVLPGPFRACIRACVESRHIISEYRTLSFLSLVFIGASSRACPSCPRRIPRCRQPGAAVSTKRRAVELSAPTISRSHALSKYFFAFFLILIVNE